MNICPEAIEAEPFDNDELERQAVTLYTYVKELSSLKY